jgi:homoaconitate hydratase family protein
MGTLSEEILSKNVGREVVQGEIIIAKVDHVMSHDTTTPLAIKSMQKMEKSIKNQDEALIFFDHIVPAPTIQAQTLQKQIRLFVADQGIKHFYQEGISHQLIAEKGFALPGKVIVGADSHSCTHGALGCFSTGMGSTDIAVAYATGKTWLRVPETIELQSYGSLPESVYPKDLILTMVGKVGAEGANYKAVEYTGSAISDFNIEDRLTLTSMAVEMGGKAGVIKADEITRKYVNGRGIYLEPVDPKYSETYEFDLADLTPKVALPHRVDNVENVEDHSGLPVDQVFIGTCTNGRLSDMAIVAKYLKGNQISPSTRMVITPASVSIQMEAYRLGYIDIFNQAGAVVTNPGCGPCIGRHQGVLAPDEVAVTTMNRNFQGRMGSPEAGIWLTSPATAAATALKGRLTDPREVKL